MKNSLQSSSFLASCGAIFQSLLCTGRQILPKFGGDWKYYYWLIGLVAGTGILIEKKPRRSELALYVQSKTFCFVLISVDSAESPSRLVSIDAE